MNKKTDQIVSYLSDVEIFSVCTSMELARLAPYIEMKNYKSGETVFSAEEDGENVFILVEGEVELVSGGRLLSKVTEGPFGEESLYKNSKYLSSSKVVKDSVLLVISNEHFSGLLKSNEVLKDDFYSSLLNHYTEGRILKNLNKFRKDEEKVQDQPQKMKITGWLLTIIVPIIIINFGDSWGLDWKTKIYFTVTSATIIMWIFRLSHEFIPSIFAVLVILILDIAPPSVALSGFTSGSFFMALSIFGLSAILVSSGLTYRLVINLFRFLPISQFWHSFAIFLTGIFLTPILPSANGRISLSSPILNDMIESLGYKRPGKASTRLSIATFSGFTMFSSIFLSSKAIHFVVYGLLPVQVREQFSWGYWFYAASVAGLVMFIFFLIFAGFMFKNNEKSVLSRDQIDAQYKILGKMTMQEWAALAGIFLFFVGIATSTIHKIQLPWIGLTVLYVVLAMEFLTKKAFKTSIDWTFLIYLGTLIGLVKSMSYIGLDYKIGTYFAWLGDYAVSNFPLFVVFLTLSIFALRLFIPNNAAVAILASVLLPIAGVIGVNPWIVGFIILIMSDAWFMPYQSTYYILFNELTGKRKLYINREMLKFNLISVGFRIIAVFVSIPFWRYLGLL